MPLSTARAAAPISGFVAAEAVFSSLVSQLQSSDTARMTHSDLEQLLEREGRELMRQLLQAHLDQRTQATAETPVVGANRVLRTHARHGTRALETIVGTVAVSRAGHGARGCETLFPADAGLNLPRERYSFGVRRRAAEEATKGIVRRSRLGLCAPFGRGGGQAAGRGRRPTGRRGLRQLLL
jgi:hypothetical protein